VARCAGRSFAPVPLGPEVAMTPIPGASTIDPDTADRSHFGRQSRRTERASLGALGFHAADPISRPLAATPPTP
jgi:hypothetical protein